MPSINGENLTHDSLLYGKLRLYQEREGYRFSVDSVLLADFVETREGEECLELGTGCGVVSLLLYKTKTFGKITAVEIQKDLVRLARENVKLNEAVEKIEILHADIRRLQGLLGGESFDVVFSNPPFRRVGEGRLSKRPGPAIAKHEVICRIEDIVETAAFLLRPEGRLFLIHLYEREREIIGLLERAGLHPSRIRPVVAREGDEAGHVLLEALKGRKAGGAKKLSPLVIHRSTGAYTEEMERIFRGRERTPGGGK